MSVSKRIVATDEVGAMIQKCVAPDRVGKTVSVIGSIKRTGANQPHKQAEIFCGSHHEPEVECIGKGKSHKPWEFGVKA